MDKEIFIHIGAPRTGTSYLRNNIFPYINNVYFENKLKYLKNGDFRIVEFFSKMGHYGDGDELSASIFSETMPHIEKNKILISEEHFIWSVYHMMGNIGSRALMLKKCCPNAKIIMTIRRQPEYFISLFKYLTTLDTSTLQRQMVRIDNMINLDCALEQLKIYFKIGFPSGVKIVKKYQMSDPSEKYFDRHYRHFISADFSWLRLFEIYKNLFGQDNILILPQEMILNDIDSTINLLSHFLDEKIDPKQENLVNRDNSTKKVVNPFRNKDQKMEFVNYVMQLNMSSNRELDKEIKYVDLKKYQYTECLNRVPRKIIFGFKSSRAVKLNPQQFYYINVIINSFKRRGLINTFV
ncbi:hypothetical protein ACFLZQ_03050, partial [Thermodesulfobacteriota bacterium]